MCQVAIMAKAKAYDAIQERIQATLLDIIDKEWDNDTIVTEYRTLSQVKEDMYREVLKALGN